MHFVNDTDNLVRSVLHKNSLDECDAELLTGLVTEYPYAAVFHVLLMAKLKDRKIAGPAQKRLAELYFSNPLWLKQAGTKENIVSMESKYPGEQPESSEPAVPDAADRPLVIEHAPANFAENNAVIHNREVEEQVTDENTEVEQVHDDTNLPPIKIAPLDIRPLDPNASLTFEPFHTVDYFASQGIRVSEEDRPKDKFGQQLKSFTQWLKTLKKTPEAVDVVLPAVIEEKVEQMAMHSLDQSEVVTEAMAEVWEKQGNHKAARAVYDKLKLLNPSKSAYFAAKIEQLK